MPANVQTMAYYKDAPWHGVGREVPRGCSIAEMMKAAGLDWMVVKRPARGATKYEDGKYSKYEIVRMPRSSDEKEVLLGLVSNGYTPLQNHEAFEFFEPVLSDKKVFFETAGALGDGERVWVLANMGEEMEIVKNDVCKKYLLLSNTHNGKGSVIVKFTPVRVVCENTLIMALENGSSAYRVRHTSKVAFKLHELGQFLAMVKATYGEIQECLQAFANVQMTTSKLFEYFESVYPRKESQKRNEKIPRVWRELVEIMDTKEDLNKSAVRGTLWAAYNAITYYEDYKQPRNRWNDSMSQRLGRVWFGSGAERKLRAYETGKNFL